MEADTLSCQIRLTVTKYKLRLLLSRHAAAFNYAEHASSKQRGTSSYSCCSSSSSSSGSYASSACYSSSSRCYSFSCSYFSFSCCYSLLLLV